MDNNGNRQSRARRRPENITGIKTSGTNTNKRQNGVSEGSSHRGVRANRDNNTAQRNASQNRNQNTMSSGRSHTPVRVNQLTPVEERALRRKEKSLVRAERREEAWQKDIIRVRTGVDKFLLVIILILLVLGSITVFSSSYPQAIKEGLSSYAFIFDQVQFLLFGFIAFFVTFYFPVKWYKSWLPPVVYVIAAIMLIAALFVGTKEGVTTRWLDLGPINVQPSEVMKVSLILMIAWYAERYSHKMSDLSRGAASFGWNTFLPDVIVGVACVLVLIGKHLSGTIIVGAIGVALLVVAGCKIAWLLETILPAGAIAVAWFLVNNQYALERITSFQNENADKLDELYQTTQSVYAIGSGGLLGVGLGASRQKYSYLGAAHTDFIFSIWCEEMGFVGAVALIILFTLFVWRGYVIALRAPDKFSMLVAFGITTHIGLQAFLNMCVASDLIMNTGVTLPFFSYGGSALVITLAEMGILLKISRHSYRKKSDIEHDEMARRAGLL